jgi:hypothetical protein
LPPPEPGQLVVIATPLALSAKPELHVPADTPLSVTAPVADSVVKNADDGVVPPIDGGAANRLVNPEPDTAPEALKLVKAPVFAALDPIGEGDANVAPFRLDAFKFATFVVDDTTSGGVGEATVEISCEPVIVEVVKIDPKPDAIDPDASAPTLVRDDETMFDARLVPVKVEPAWGGEHDAPRVHVAPLIVIVAVARFEIGNAEINVFDIKPPAEVSTIVELPVAPTGNPADSAFPPVPLH